VASCSRDLHATLPLSSIGRSRQPIMASLPGWERPNPGPTLRPSLFRATCAHLPRRGGSTQNLHGKYSDGGGVGPGPATFDRHRLTPPILPRFPLAHATHRPPFRSRTGSSQEILRFRANPARAHSRHRPVGRLFCFVINRGVVNQSKKNRGVVNQSKKKSWRGERGD
jgi:hypothetical protein